MVAGMLMPLRDLRAIYEVLFRDGVMVAKKDKRPQAMHPEIEGVSNLQVIRAMGSLKSRGCVKETFAWRHFYWYLTNEGIVYLREYLHLPPEIVPASLQRVRKQTATLAIAHRAARVQSVEGPTSYVPKPRYRGDTESQDALAERQGYRHKMMGPGESDSYSDRTPRFRGRPLAAEPVRPKAPWEMQDESQPLLRKGGSFRTEAAVMEETRVKRVTQLQHDVSGVKPVTKSKEVSKVSEIRKEKASEVQRAALKPDVSQTTLTSISSKTVATVAEATGSPASKVPAKLSAAKINEEKFKITDETISTSSSKMVTSNSAFTTIPNTDLKEKPKKLTVGPGNPTEAIAEITPDNVKSQDVDTVVTAPTVIKTPVSKVVKEEKTTKVIVDPVKSAEVKANAEKPSGKVKAQAITTMLASQETLKVLTDSAAPVITKDTSKNVKEEKPKKENFCEELVKSAAVKTPAESKVHQEKSKKRSQSTKPPPDTTTEPVLLTETVNEFHVVEIQKMEVTSVILPTKPKPDEVLLKTTLLAESSKHEVKTTKTETSAEDTDYINGKVIVTEVVKKGAKGVQEVTPHVEKDEKTEPEEALKVLVQGPTLAQKDSSPPQLNQCATTEVVKENKQVVEGRSKSKKKKKKSPGEIVQTEELPDSKSEMETAIIDKPSGELAKNPTPAITSEPGVSTFTKPERASPVIESRIGVEIAIDGGKMKEFSYKTDETLVIKVPIQTVDQSMSKVAPLKSDPVPLVPPMELPGCAQVKEKVEGGCEMTLGSLHSEDKLLHTGPMKSEELTVTKVETVVVHKKIEVELKEASPAGLSQEPVVEDNFPISTRKPAEESSKSRKKGKGKKQAQAAVSDTLNTEPALLLETSPSMSITSLHEAPVNTSLIMVSEPTEVSVSPKMTPERMCSEETRQAAAVLSEAPADKGEVEPTLLFAEKIKREVPKPKTSSAAREAHAAGELASAAPVAAAEAAAAQASPLSQQEEPPKVAQHSASQAAERCTEKQLSVLPAQKQEEEKKRDLQEDTPSGPVTQAAAQPEQPHLEHTCESIGSDVDEGTMRKKIVVVEEIVEVKQVLSPQAAGQLSSPPPVQPEVEGEELDLDVLEAIAIERALLSGAAGAAGDCVQGASPEQDWDHSLEEPEEKTWPNFIEGLFALINLLPAWPHSFPACDAIHFEAWLLLLFDMWEVSAGVFDNDFHVGHPSCHVHEVCHTGCIL